jgi:Caspase domain/Tetratricopeptide repeat
MKRIGCDTKVLETDRPTRAGHWRKESAGRAQSSGSSPKQGNLGMRLILFLALAVIVWVQPAFAQQGNGSCAAILIGNSDYMWGGDPGLKEPINDARSLGDELKRAGFDVEVRENLTKDEMQRALNGFYAKIKRGMTGLVFFSGYGIQANRQSYLIPVDVDIWNESEVQPKGVSLDNILAEMNKRGANVKIAIVDAARRNPFERRFRKAGAEGLPPVSAPLGTLVLYSATAGTPGGLVKDSAAERSLFVGELVKEIRGQGVSAEEVFNRTRMGVSRASSNEQNPWISSSLSQEFSFPSCGRGAAPRIVNNGTTNTNTNTGVGSPNTNTGIGSSTNTGTNTNTNVNTGTSTTASNNTSTFEAPPPRQQPPQPPACVVANVPPPKPIGTPPSEELRGLDERVRRNTRDAVAFYRRGQFYARYSQFTRAISDFDEAIRLKPDDPEALNNRCWARTMLGDTTKALQDCNEALKLRPAYGDALDSRGLINLKLCHNTEALSDYDSAVKYNPRQASSLFGRGVAKLRIGNTAGGNDDIVAAKAIAPSIAEEFKEYGVTTGTSEASAR